MTATTRLAWFPLVRRPRPPALPLRARISELRDLAQSSEGDPVQAAEALNKAALIASDCGLPDLARALCWRQYEIFDRARPLPPSTLNLALQPILNLPRQLIRDGEPERAHAMLEILYRAARDRTDAVIYERTIRLHDLTRAPDEHRTVRTLTWAALLADGTRALTINGRWREAAERTAAHRGVGRRLLDGRQVAILALLHHGELDEAAAMVEQSTIVEPWEQAVQNLLHVLCCRNRARSPHVAAMLSNARTLLERPDPPSARFSTRVGLLALDLAGDAPIHRDAHLQAVITTAMEDAHAARDALAHPVMRAHAADQELADLERTVRTAGLGVGTIALPMRQELLESVSVASEHLTEALKVQLGGTLDCMNPRPGSRQ